MNDYIKNINEGLKPNEDLDLLVLDLFAGAGGLSLGFESQGFRTIGYEMNTDASNTYNENLIGHCYNTLLTLDMEYPKAPIIIGGPPCQPFSVGGKQKGTSDTRNGFPIFLDAVRKVKPKLFLFENVRGLLYKNKWYFDEIKKEFEDLGYTIDYRLINFKTYGVPQSRERVIVVGHKGHFKFPDPVEHIVTAGEALDDTKNSAPPESKFLTPSMDQYIAKYEKASKCKNPRDLYMDRPSRTLTCRNLAGSTGDMLRIKLPDGRRRRLLINEASRLQSFPDWFKFKGNETSVFNQIGNAVPPLFSMQIAKSVKDYMFSENELHEQIKETKKQVIVNESENEIKQLTLFDCEV
ncbi:DNA cytosine methyltransferase [Bacillus sp. SPARC3]|uniref:DNA cytosine methyltransferase n=1 Tax=Bacillus sp. SPARC3 TaxID=2841275 RepID=UPI001C933C07|nr:DNA cytosine methyltransferase [Bacillus sp. SPARC3]MBY4605453.1 DNA cytosine methyltransferase [Bacillus sp. SPARC3]